MNNVLYLNDYFSDQIKKIIICKSYLVIVIH
uniref:Uncharacterized protein n=1 Tax=Lepeophtheirus salmonis TaxID=72036 RepID=A0A0K2UVP6_LEPSM